MMSILDLRSRDDARRFIHSVAPAIAVLMVSMGVLDRNVAMLGVAVVLAVFNDTLAHINSSDSFRKWFYPVLTSATTMLIGLGMVTDEQLTPWIAIITILIGGGVAAKNATPEEPEADDDEPSGKHATT
ncbi:holin [Mycobacterium phage BoostSeason]|uniref:Holin n=2 Tax=Timquatrovirus TaxID=1623306 RepID=A0A0M3UKI2_9CAUD|nr:holin [Mycobacterium phage Mufasa]YP_009951116.1 holin [Mycobacterium phage Findley]ALF00465.1 holin [Mycobacterium phage Mufasa]ASR86770.1 holin [Mycobacterium phage Findley]AYN57204.1 holin [Mycobacterium phage BoostSeason]